MSGEAVKLIEISIALIFIYLTLSILVTSIVQIFASFLRLRSVNLVQGMAMLLNDAYAATAAAKDQGANADQRPEWQKFLLMIFGIVPMVVNVVRTVLAMLIVYRGLDGRLRPFLVGKEGKAVNGTLAGEVLAHPLINCLASGNQVASHIEPKTFAAALVDVLRVKAIDKRKNAAGGNTGDGAITATSSVTEILGALGEAENKAITRVLNAVVVPVEAAAKNADERATAALDAIAKWYDSAMVSIANWYKERSKLLTLIVAVVMTVGANVDSLRIVEVLWSNGDLRNSLVTQAMKTEGLDGGYKSKCPALPDKADAAAIQKDTQCQLGVIRDMTASLDTLPFGWWGDATLDRLLGNGTAAPVTTKPADTAAPPPAAPAITAPPATTAPATTAPAKAATGKTDGEVWFHRIIGWLLTAFALSLGAPFWFDLLSQIISLRNGPKAGALSVPPQTATN